MYLVYTSATTYKTYTCSVKNGMIAISLSSSSYAYLVNSTPSYPRTMVITNMLNPAYPNTYTIRVNAFFYNAASTQYPYS